MSAKSAAVLVVLLLVVRPLPATAQVPRALMPIEFENSAEFGWLNKPVMADRVLDDMTDPASWSFQGTGTLTFPAVPALDGMRYLRVDMQMFVDSPAPTRNGLSAVNLRRAFAGEDWSGYNRISLWIRPDISGFPMLPLQIVLRNEGAVEVPDAYNREGIHYVTLKHGVWQQVVWEITPLARDRVTRIEIGYWVNKLLAAPSDRVAFEIGRLELQRVEPDNYEGWSVAPGRVAFSHTGYQPGSTKTAVLGGTDASRFRLIRLDDTALGDVVLTGPVTSLRSRLGDFRVIDFSAVDEPGRYVIEAGALRTRPFRVDANVWRGTVMKALNFFYGQRCGYAVPGSHDVDHGDWLLAHGDRRIVMNGGWHDAGDLSQGTVNTGEAVYSMFALAERLQETGEDPELLERLLEEANWGLDWVLRVRFEGGRRLHFASHNLWTNGIIGDADDRVREALNNPNVNYIAAAAAAIAYRVLKGRDPARAERSLAVAEEDWRHAIDGVEGPGSWNTSAFSATAMELAGIGILASLELHAATGRPFYAGKAVELARTVVSAQQKRFVGTGFPLAGFFYTGPDRDTLFSQFHRGNDQAPIVALARLAETLPDHPDWMSWYSTVAFYAEYQKRTAATTAPYHVLPAYVYRDTDHLQFREEGALHMATRDAFREQVLQGMPMGEGWYLRALPVWFARRGNYGILLSQAKALSAAAHLRRDVGAADLAQQQAQWIVGRNPFVQSTMYGEGYDWPQQYAVSSGDFVGALPVGMQSRGITDLPYWPSQNTYVFKEVWVHPVSRWIWLMQDIAGPGIAEVRTGTGPARVAELTDVASSRTFTADVDRTGRARTALPAGRYAVRAGDRRTTVTVLPGATRDIDLRPGHALDFTIEAASADDGTVTISLEVTGEGTHSFALRATNLATDRAARTVTLEPGHTATVQWRARMLSPDEPWVAVVVPDGDVSARQEVVGWAPRYDVPPTR